jgi:hypothetical protein
LSLPRSCRLRTNLEWVSAAFDECAALNCAAHGTPS